MTARTVLFAAGGSGGHLFPALAVAEELLATQPQIRIGIAASEKPIDHAVLAGSPYAVWHLPSVSPSRFWREPFTVLRHSWASWQAARNLIRETRPAVVVGCGGFASAPVVWAAIRAKVPVVLLEQNLIPGRANAWLSRWASRICLSFDETRGWLPKRPEVIQVTGNPVRRSLRTPSSSARAPRQLLILGGSQGARHLNEAVAAWVTLRPDSLQGWQITHQTGTADQAALAMRYESLAGFCDITAIDFIRDPEPLYRAATLVIARAGATSLAELACLGTPTILVPLPSAARDHQTANARWYSGRGAARLLLQSDTPADTARHLGDLFASTIPDVSRLGEAIRDLARPEAATQVAELLRSYL
jgi:UDP-N-acetylglucosamine--N-acetylmuramyl-(pentapeptide) pyrophosphoryl-undecaprenol N-acetylglucosamine transferase